GFTPSSFRLIVKDLYEIGHLGLREQFFSETDIFEFFISLSRRGPGCPFDRLTLARMTVAEQQEIPIGPVCHRQPSPVSGMDRTALMLSQFDLSGIGL